MQTEHSSRDLFAGARSRMEKFYGRSSKAFSTPPGGGRVTSDECPEIRLTPLSSVGPMGWEYASSVCWSMSLPRVHLTASRNISIFDNTIRIPSCDHRFRLISRQRTLLKGVLFHPHCWSINLDKYTLVETDTCLCSIIATHCLRLFHNNNNCLALVYW